MTPAADFFRALPVSGKGLALLGSVSVHAAVALAVVRGAPHTAPGAPAVEVVAFELELTEATVQPLPASLPASPSARHHHDYPVPPNHDSAVHDASIRHVLPHERALNLPPAAAPAVIDSPAPAMPRFVIALGPRTPSADRASDATASAQAPGKSAIAEPAPESAVDLPAKLLSGSSPSYTREAEAAGIEADVPLEIVVDGTGSVLSARALAHIGYGLEEAAVRSIRSYRFSPARRGTKSLAVRMHWLMRFQLR